MPVHAVRVETSKVSSGVPIETILSQFGGSRSTVLDEEAIPPGLIEPTDPEPLDEPYRRAFWRFDPGTHSVAALLNDLETSLSGNAEWYRIRYHSCDHDRPAADRGGCTWDSLKARFSGPVPSELA
jgi:hypothetical protein